MYTNVNVTDYNAIIHSYHARGLHHFTMNPPSKPMIISFLHQTEREWNACYQAGSMAAVEGVRKCPYSMIANAQAKAKFRKFQDPPKPAAKPEMNVDDADIDEQQDNGDNNQSEQPHVATAALNQALNSEIDQLKDALLTAKAKNHLLHALLTSTLDEFLFIGQPQRIIEFIAMNSYWDEFPELAGFYFNVKNYTHNSYNNTEELQRGARMAFALETDDEYSKGVDLYEQYKQLKARNKSIAPQNVVLSSRPPAVPSVPMASMTNDPDDECKKIKIEPEKLIHIDLTDSPPPPNDNVAPMVHESPPKQEVITDPMELEVGDSMNDRLIQHSQELHDDDEDVVNELLLMCEQQQAEPN